MTKKDGAEENGAGKTTMMEEGCLESIAMQ